MTRKILIATVSAFALSSGAALAEGDCGKMDHMQNAAMSVQTGDNIQLAQNDAAGADGVTQEGDKTKIEGRGDSGPTEAVGDQVGSGDAESQGEASGDAASQDGEATKVEPGSGPTESVGEAGGDMKADDKPAN
jgi:hypothetical protein